MPQTARLGSRAIIGEFYARLEATPGPAWVPKLGFSVQSNMEIETYAWLGMSPAMREWIGGRQAQGLRVNGLTVANKDFEATLEIATADLRRDKTGQIMARVGELATRTKQHDASLVSALILANPLCYDGQAFFDTDHAEGKSGVQSNVVAFDISDGVGSTGGGTATAPTAITIQRAAIAAVARMLAFMDDQGEPLNDGATEFIAMFPPSMMGAGLSALTLPTLVAGESNVIPANGEFSIKPVINPRLTAWTDSFAVFRADGQVKPFILQEEVGVVMDAVAEGSEEEFKNKRHLYGVTRSGNAAVGYWQHAAKVTLQA